MNPNKPLYYDGSVPVKIEEKSKEAYKETVVKPEGISNSIKFPYFPYSV